MNEIMKYKRTITWQRILPTADSYWSHVEDGRIKTSIIWGQNKSGSLKDLRGWSKEAPHLFCGMQISECTFATDKDAFQELPVTHIINPFFLYLKPHACSTPPPSLTQKKKICAPNSQAETYEKIYNVTRRCANLPSLIQKSVVGGQEGFEAVIAKLLVPSERLTAGWGIRRRTMTASAYRRRASYRP